MKTLSTRPSFKRTHPGNYVQLIASLVLAWSNGAGAACLECTPNTAPNVVLTSPVNGASSNVPGSFTLSADATDGDGQVISVEFFSNNISVGVDYAEPFSMPYGGLAAGSYAIKAKATDDLGKSRTSTIVTVTVSASTNVAPTITLTGPTNAATATAPASFTMSATANDADGTVARVDFMSGASVVYSDTSSPYSYTLSGLTAGTYQLQAIAIDNLGAMATSAMANVTVTAGNTPPTITLTSPASGSSGLAPASVTLMASAADPGGAISSVSFWSNGALLGPADTTEPYSLVASGLAAGTYLLKAVATDNSGATATSATVTYVVTAPTPAVSLARTFVYDTYERLCKTINPESGATFLAYDASGNIAWTAEGTTFVATTDALSCEAERNSISNSAKTTMQYDAMNRVTAILTPGHVADVTTEYAPDGKIARRTANNGADPPVVTDYTYNKRRLLTQEVLQVNPNTWTFAYAYDVNGHMSSQTYPGNLVVGYAPNALGQPSQVGTFASGVSYYPNGAISGFTYGNGISHSMTPNLRQLPGRSLDSYIDPQLATAKVIDDSYGYDGAGNVTDISDQARNGATTRGMAYDGLDRLRTVVSPTQTMFGVALYSYDALDNLRTAAVGSAGYAFAYDASNRLSSLTRSGGGTYAFVTDPTGNITSDALRGQSYVFDSAHRMTAIAGKQSYWYDGNGRRVRSLDSVTGTVDLFGYGQSGQLLQDWSNRRANRKAYIYLGNSLIATYGVTISGPSQGAVEVLYQHTDALGSPVAVTDANKYVVSRTSYTPYGLPLMPVDGVGYAGHEMDIGTGLSYMQQRYYDPQLGRFLSIDPIGTNGSIGANFNRYYYANDNPYRFTDSDGRLPSVFDGLKAVAGRLQTVSRKMQEKGDITVEGGAAAGMGVQFEFSLLSGKGSIAIIPAGEGLFGGVMVAPNALKWTLHKGQGHPTIGVTGAGGWDVRGVDLNRGNGKVGALLSVGADVNADLNGTLEIQPKAGVGIGELVSSPGVTIVRWGKLWDGSR